MKDRKKMILNKVEEKLMETITFCDSMRFEKTDLIEQPSRVWKYGYFDNVWKDIERRM